MTAEQLRSLIPGGEGVIPIPFAPGYSAAEHIDGFPLMAADNIEFLPIPSSDSLASHPQSQRIPEIQAPSIDFQAKADEAHHSKPRNASLRDHFDRITGAYMQVEPHILASRESRLAFERAHRLGDSPHPIHRLFRTGPGRWVLKPLLEGIPSPIAYGPGDVITAVSALKGNDILTGEALDTIDRILYGIASFIPFIPSGALVEPVLLLRRWGEDFAHARRYKYIPRIRRPTPHHLWQGAKLLIRLLD